MVHSPKTAHTQPGSADGGSRPVHGVMAAPCKSCPYRKDVPSGVWEAHEYDKLPGYDGEIFQQLSAGAVGLFLCHQRDGSLCAGWLASHGPSNLLAMRLNAASVTDEVWTYRTAVPVWASGREAREHGQRDIEEPGSRANRMMARLVSKLPAAGATSSVGTDDRNAGGSAQK